MAIARSSCISILQDLLDLRRQSVMLLSDIKVGSTCIFDEKIFEQRECCILLERPHPVGVLLGEPSQRFADDGEILDET